MMLVDVDRGRAEGAALAETLAALGSAHEPAEEEENEQSFGSEREWERERAREWEHERLQRMLSQESVG
jgi:hypothetical protein